MNINPLYEDSASTEVAECYATLKKALETPTLPLFFTYIGPFPKYLSYITSQLADNLTNNEFKTLSNEIAEQLLSTIHDSLPQSQALQEWKNRYRQSPSFYNFQNDLKNIYLTNVKLTFIFLALREAVKGWAIAAKKLPDATFQSEKYSEPHTPEVSEHEFVFNDTVLPLVQGQTNDPSSQIIPSNREISVSSGDIEASLLPEYLRLTRNEFSFHLKTTEFWPVRIGVEKMILNSLGLMPSLIFSPINVVLKLTAEYKHFPELLHLLSDHFPTYSVHRLMFSAFMKETV